MLACEVPAHNSDSLQQQQMSVGTPTRTQWLLKHTNTQTSIEAFNLLHTCNSVCSAHTPLSLCPAPQRDVAFIELGELPKDVRTVVVLITNYGGGRCRSLE